MAARRPARDRCAGNRSGLAKPVEADLEPKQSILLISQRLSRVVLPKFRLEPLNGRIAPIAGVPYEGSVSRNRTFERSIGRQSSTPELGGERSFRFRLSDNDCCLIVKLPASSGTYQTPEKSALGQFGGGPKAVRPHIGTRVLTRSTVPPPDGDKPGQA
jgi:hypothetical protein